MRSATIKTGLKLLIAAVCLLILASFYGEAVAGLLHLPEIRFVSVSFFLGGMLGGGGVVVVIIGLLRSASPGGEGRLLPTLLLLCAVILLFFLLLYRSLTVPEEIPRLRPGETIVI